METPENLIAELEEMDLDPAFPVTCPQCGEPALVHCMTAWCVSKTCPAHEFEWDRASGLWVENEDKKLSIELQESLQPLVDDLLY